MKREDQLRCTALDMAIRAGHGNEPPSYVTGRADAFLTFLKGPQKPTTKKPAKR